MKKVVQGFPSNQLQDFFDYVLELENEVGKMEEIKAMNRKLTSEIAEMHREQINMQEQLKWYKERLNQFRQLMMNV